MGIFGWSDLNALFVIPSLPSSWFIDYGASNHMTLIENELHDLTHYDGKERITTANGQHLSIADVGSVDLKTPQNQSLPLASVYFVPKLSANLISIGQLVNHGYSIFFLLLVV